MSLLARIGRLFPRNEATDAVVTTMHVDAPPEAVWRAMVFYEEIPRRPSPLLRLLLPTPLRTEGEKTRPGALVECTYDGGHLQKVITGVEPPRALRFDVRVQALGIEDCITMTGGSYELAAGEGGTEVVLTTRYRGHLRPRWLFRPFERFVAHRVHRHILSYLAARLHSETTIVATSPEGGVKMRTPGSPVSNVQSPQATVTGRKAGGTEISVGADTSRLGS
jgi:uncharacterized protein YndB with AHSA1/START domain